MAGEPTDAGQTETRNTSTDAAAGERPRRIWDQLSGTKPERQIAAFRLSDDARDLITDVQQAAEADGYRLTKDTVVEVAIREYWKDKI